MIRRVALALLGAGVALPGAASAQAAPNVSIPLGIHVGIPQGEFGQNVALAGGIGGGGIWAIGPAFGLRADLGFMIYGSDTRRVPLGGGALGLINVDVTTTNMIFGGGIGGQLGVPNGSLMPYVGGMIGFSAFTTTSSVEGSNSADEPFASSTNSSDAAFAKTVLAGLYIPLARGSAMIDLGVRHTWNGKQVRYLTEGDITEDVNGDIVLSPRETRADILTIVIGVSIRPSGVRR